MPTVVRISGYRFFFFSRDFNEPTHIHIEKNGAIAKFWLEPISLARSDGFKQHELNEIRKLLEKHKRLLVKSWYDYFEAQS